MINRQLKHKTECKNLHKFRKKNTDMRPHSLGVPTLTSKRLSIHTAFSPKTTRETFLCSKVHGTYGLESHSRLLAGVYEDKTTFHVIAAVTPEMKLSAILVSRRHFITSL